MNRQLREFVLLAAGCDGKKYEVFAGYVFSGMLSFFYWQEYTFADDIRFVVYIPGRISVQEYFPVMKTIFRTKDFQQRYKLLAKISG